MRFFVSIAAAVTFALLPLLGCAPSFVTEETVTFQGVSMRPGIKDGDRIRLVRFDRGAEFKVARGDIVMSLYPDDPSKSYVKRLIGLPGETVEIRDAKVYVNGAELAEPYVDPELNVTRQTMPPVLVRPHHYFVMGDNRDNSADSRHWGLVPEKYVLGKVVGR